MYDQTITFIKGNHFEDQRGKMTFNNDFDASEVRRLYFIENADLQVKRGWQGHRVEQRWFAAAQGELRIKVVEIDSWEQPSKNCKISEFLLSAKTMDVLHVPAGCCTFITAETNGAKLLVMADYLVGEIKDEYRFPSDYFEK